MTVLPNPIATGFSEFLKDLTLLCSFGSDYEERYETRDTRVSYRSSWFRKDRKFCKDLTLPCSFGSETTRNGKNGTVPRGFARILPCLVVLEAKPRGTVRNARAGYDGQYWDVKCYCDVSRWNRQTTSFLDFSRLGTCTTTRLGSVSFLKAIMLA